MEWRQDFETGFEHLDDQHRMLIHAVECFRNSLKLGAASRPYDAFLSFLTVYGMIHFEEEENCMRAHRCSATARNCLEHKAFRVMVDREWTRLDLRGFEPEKARALLRRMDRWLSVHLAQVDAQLRRKYSM